MTRAMTAAATPGRAGAAEVHEVVAALGQRLDDRRQRRHADLQARVEGDVDLGDGAQPAVDVGVGADDLDLEAGHAALADLVERVRHAVHAADAVGHERDAQRVAFALHELALLAAEEGGRGRVGDGRDAGVEEAGRGGAEVAAAWSWRPGRRRPRRASLRSCARRARRKRSAWLKSSCCRSASSSRSPRRRSMASSQACSSAAGVVGAEVGADRAARGRRPRASRARPWSAPRAGRPAPPSPRPSARTASAIALCAHLAALPCSPRAAARPARTWPRSSCQVSGDRASR